MMQRKEALQRAGFEQMMQKSQLDIVERQHAGNHAFLGVPRHPQR
jgi:hypothetical protein